ncbi:MAG: thymidine phosphorylase [candidate division WOR-3 bacterium]
MRAVDIIRKKRNGEKLGRKEIEFIVKNAISGEIPDYQLSALLMAIYFSGMDIDETKFLTEFMMKSGEILDWKFLKKPTVDKHSTGGVGDKISLILAPLVASTNLVAVPMISGRALGHTGGTLDKLESIKGYKTNLTIEEFKDIVKKVGCSIIGQTENLVPADKKFYALRDATATVESIPLIASSIMSKKLAEGVDAIILDVKTGSGAFMQKQKDAKELATLMVEIGKRMNKKVIALITNMDQPLGMAVGNALEVKEAVDTLKGRGPDDVTELTLKLGAYMLYAVNVVNSVEEGYKKLKENLYNGEGLRRLRQMIEAHGGDWNYILSDEFTRTKYVYQIRSNASGFISQFDTYTIGLAAQILGAGRSKIDDIIDHKVGIIVYKKVGDKVDEGDVIFEIRANSEQKMNEVVEMLEMSYRIVKRKPQPPPLIYEVIE